MATKARKVVAKMPQALTPSADYACGVVRVLQHCYSISPVEFTNTFVIDNEQGFADALGVPLTLVQAAMGGGVLEQFHEWQTYPHREAIEKLLEGAVRDDGGEGREGSGGAGK
jgi:hypothetical protein